MIPELSARYLHRSVARDARDALKVEVDLVGRLRLNDKWIDFQSTLSVDALSGFHWKAKAHRGLLYIFGHDEYKDGHGEMLWKLYGLIPLVHAENDDITHSARGRAALEQIFIPSALQSPLVQWTVTDDGWTRASWDLHGEVQNLEMKVGVDGAITAVRMQRWSNANGTPWKFVTFGADIACVQEFNGLTVPAQFTAGWFYGDPNRWETEGKFFEAHVTALRRM
mmetsp:Transcript_12432/g.27148  ORF Transcript_12432/g.27148 Transcript_12432/m.27148 type:complete len:224 (-) Transcript_12432:341-1012(-)